MTSIPASRRARAMILAPRSCPSRPGFATRRRIFLVEEGTADMAHASALGERRRAEVYDEDVRWRSRLVWRIRQGRILLYDEDVRWRSRLVWRIRQGRILRG